MRRWDETNIFRAQIRSEQYLISTISTLVRMGATEGFIIVIVRVAMEQDIYEN